MLGLVCIFLFIRSFIAFVRFILNVNHDKVFVKENIPLLRWAGWGMMIPAIIYSVHDLVEHFPADNVYNSYMDDFVFGLFCLIIAEVFAIGLKLKEEQDLTI
jgi:bacteriorhodopsin